MLNINLSKLDSKFSGHTKKVFENAIQKNVQLYQQNHSTSSHTFIQPIEIIYLEDSSVDKRHGSMSFDNYTKSSMNTEVS